MSKYEYVKRNEYQPVRVELENIIKRTQKILRKNKTGITFQFELIGSGSKHLITRIIGGNKGFDFDYNIILNCDPDHYWKAKYAREEVTKAIKKAIKGTQYSNPQNSEVAITIKVKDIRNSKIVHSCDFAIVYYPGNLSEGHKYVKLDLATNEYGWQVRKFTKNYHDKLNWLKENIDNYWDDIKKEYLKLKNNNKDQSKHSFQLFYETINNVFNWY